MRANHGCASALIPAARQATAGLSPVDLQLGVPGKRLPFEDADRLVRRQRAGVRRSGPQRLGLLEPVVPHRGRATGGGRGRRLFLGRRAQAEDAHERAVDHSEDVHDDGPQVAL